MAGMLTLENIGYEVAGREVFRDVSFSINRGDKIGLVGYNGAGKTTLLKIILGQIEPLNGRIIGEGEEAGFLPQDLRAWLDLSARDFVESVTGVAAAREEFDKQCEGLSNDSGDEAMTRYAAALERYEKFDVAAFDANLEKALSRAGIGGIRLEQSIGSFSGGQRTRIALAALFLARYDLILLDEPTNNMDEAGVELLENFVRQAGASFLIVSHDRRFLRNATTRIIELVGQDQGVKQFDAGYDEYVEARQSEKAAIAKHYEQYEVEKKRLKKAAREANIRANSASSNSSAPDKDKLNAHFRSERAGASLAKGSSSIASRVDQLEEPERPEEEVSLRFRIDKKSPKKQNLLHVTGLEMSFDSNHHIGPVSFSVRSGERVLLRGQNGSGKTSIVRAIMEQLPKTAGDVYLNKKAGVIYVDQQQTLPLPGHSPLENLRRLAPGLEVHDAISLLVSFNLNKQAIMTTSVEELSGGERAKVLLAAIAANESELIILDEPTNNLDIPTIEALEQALINFDGGILLVSHDRDFVDNIGITRAVQLV